MRHSPSTAFTCLLALIAAPLWGATLDEGRTTDPIATLAKPAKGVSFLEPAYGTRLIRVTDQANEAPVGFVRNDYSRRQAFNCTSALQLVISYDGHWHLYRTDTNQFAGTLPGLAGDAEPQWHPTDPDILYYLPTYGVGMRVHELNVRTGASRVVGDLGARLRARWPSAAAAWTKAEGSPSADGRYWCFMVDTAAWTSVGVVCWDLATDTIVGWRNTAGDRPDHVSMSPSGAWCVVSGDSALGTTAFSRDFAQQKMLHKKSEHSDLALSSTGDDLYVAVDYQANAGDVFMVNIRTGVRTDLFPTYLSGTATALHISGKAFARPGWALVSTYADGGGARQWLHRKIFAMELKASPRIYQLAHHRTVSDGYWTEPHASVNRDFTKVAFNTTWGVATTSDIDTYRIELDADALPGATDGTPPVISAVSAGSITSSGATIAWTTNEAADTQVAYGTTASYGTTTVLATALATAHSQTLTGLLPATTYHYQVRSRDAAGNLTVSIIDRSFTTVASPDTTAPVISNVSAGSITTNGATIAWTTNEPADTQVAYGTTSAYGTASVLAATRVTAHSQALTGLHPATTYHYQVRSRDAAGNLRISTTDRTFTTAATPDATAPVISGVAVAIVPGGARMSWTTDEAATTQVEYGATAAYGTVAGAGGSLATSHAHTLTGLTPGETYHLRAMSMDASGNTVRSTDHPLTVPAGTSRSADAGQADGDDGGGCGLGGAVALLALQRLLRGDR